MRSLTLIFLLFLTHVSLGQNCSKSLERNEVDKFNGDKEIQSKRLVFDKPSLIEHRDIYFSFKDSNRMFISFEFVLNNRVNYPNGSQVGFILGNDKPIILKSFGLITEKVGTSIKINFDCQLEDRNQLDLFYLNGIKEVKFYSTNVVHELSSKEVQRTVTYFACTADEGDISKVNYIPKIINSSSGDLSESNQPLETGNCFSISSKYDKFNLDTTYSSPILKQITLYKILRKGKVIYYMSLNTQGNTVNVMEKGVTILLENDRRIERPNAEISVDATSEGFKYSAFIKLTEEEMKLISQNQMTDFRLYIYDAVVYVFDRTKYIKYAACLLYKY